MGLQPDGPKFEAESLQRGRVVGAASWGSAVNIPRVVRADSLGRKHFFEHREALRMNVASRTQVSLRPVHIRQQSCRKRQQVVARNGDCDGCCDNVAVSGNNLLPGVDRPLVSIYNCTNFQPLLHILKLEL